MPRATLDFVVLDALVDDLENIEQILGRANHATEGWRELKHGGEYAKEDVVPALLRLIRDDLVEACRYSGPERALVPIGRSVLPSGDLADFWFQITPRGTLVHSSWRPDQPAEE
jgi:hypothetical protein